MNHRLLLQAVRWELPAPFPLELELAHRLLDEVIKAHPEVTVERLGPMWNAYPWFGPEEEDYQLYTGLSFIDAVIACAEKGSPPGAP